jgi:hypothetical protein
MTTRRTRTTCISSSTRHSEVKRQIKYYASSSRADGPRRIPPPSRRPPPRCAARNSPPLAEIDPALLRKELSAEFTAVYGGTPESVDVFASPARININGEHIDYNGGLVFPAAIDKYLYLMIRKRKDTKVVYNDLRFPGEYVFDVNETFAYKKENDYANYLNGILSTMKAKDTGLTRASRC